MKAKEGLGWITSLWGTLVLIGTIVEKVPEQGPEPALKYGARMANLGWPDLDLNGTGVKAQTSSVQTPG
ncbi:hypothetical protein AKJ43_03260 [candidate division MSBL1 archaeon SCGC-AAA261D19]|uniref:Uncharacterized protein n=1 Tax=candidate division MSBL1 archaeon SCGC-AAA261D19 TaxID=1698273 RepID=A0A133V5A0_9EURY|nr:hypothetical protein AKJ43_03260 [candidate division MSBL1 archaeon SCGC-AAA261D19]